MLWSASDNDESSIVDQHPIIRWTFQALSRPSSDNPLVVRPLASRTLSFECPLERLATRAGFIGKAIAHSVTILWMYVTSVSFFHGVNRVFPFYYASEPWLP